MFSSSPDPIVPASISSLQKTCLESNSIYHFPAAMRAIADWPFQLWLDEPVCQPGSATQGGGSASFHPPPSAPHSLWNPASLSPVHSDGPTINLCEFIWNIAELSHPMEGEAGALGWEHEFRGREMGKKEKCLLSLALGSHSGGFTTCANTAFKQLLYVQFDLLFLLQHAARKGHLLFVDKEETQGIFRVISLTC